MSATLQIEHFNGLSSTFELSRVLLFNSKGSILPEPLARLIGLLRNWNFEGKMVNYSDLLDKYELLQYLNQSYGLYAYLIKL